MPRSSREAGVADHILIWRIGTDAPADQILAFPPEENGWAHAVAGLGVSPNGRFLIAVSESGAVRLWDVEGGS